MSARVLWLACALVALCSYGSIVIPREHEIAEARAHAALLYDGAEQNERHVRSAARLREVQDHVVADVRSLAGQADPSALTAATLRLFSTEGHRFGVRVTTIAPDARAADSTGSEPLIAAPATIGLTGHFRDIVAFLSDVSRHDVLISVDDVSLATDAGSRESGSPVLSASAHATFYRLRPTTLLEISHVSPH